MTGTDTGPAHGTASFDALAAALPATEQHLEWIEQIVAFGVRRPGTPQGARVTDWCAERLAALGYDVELQPVAATTSHPGPATVEAWRTDEPDRRLVLQGMTMPFSSPAHRRRLRLQQRTVDDPLHGEVAALEHVRMTELPVSLIVDAALGLHDPDGEFTDHVHVLPFGTALGKEIDAVVQSGAGAMIGVVDAPWTTADYFVPYDGRIRPIPAVWLDRQAGRALDDLLAAGPVEIELSTEVVHRESTDHNVIATASADDDGEWVVVGSHHDAPWASAVEDASGIAQVLAQATAWATVPAERRPCSLAFLLTAAHMSEGAGTQEFLRSWTHRDRIRLGLHLEHIAAEAEPDGAGGLRPTDRPEVRWWFASAPDEARCDAIATSVRDAVTLEDLDRSLVLPPEIFGPMPPTDGGFYHRAGIPMVNLLAAPMYLFDPADTVEMIHRPSLVSTSRAALRLTLDAAAARKQR